MTFNPKTILVPLSLDPEDDSELAEDAVNSACELAIKFDATLTLLHLASITIPAQNIGFEMSGKVYETLALVLQERKGKALVKLDALREHAQIRSVKAKSLLIDTSETLAHGICRVAAEEHMDLIVIGSHSRRGLKRLILGSVAEKVVHFSTVPVLLLPAHRV